MRKALFATALALGAVVALPQARALAGDLVRALHDAYMVVLVDSANFVTGCF